MIPKEQRKEIYQKLKQHYEDACASLEQAEMYRDWREKRKKKYETALMEFINEYGKFDI